MSKELDVSDAERREWAAAEYRASVIHDLRSRGWSRIDAENEADDKVKRLRTTSQQG